VNSIKVDFDNGFLYLPEIKYDVKIEFYRLFEGKIKFVNVSKIRDGKYYV
jgi:putative transposase